MRRAMIVAALVLVIAGLELSTEGVSLVLARLVAGVQAIRSGVEFHVSPARYGVGVLALGFGVALSILMVWAGQVRSAVGMVGGVCPDCGNRTRRVKRKGWHKLLSIMLGQRLARRTCEVCGWNGLSLRT